LLLVDLLGVVRLLLVFFLPLAMSPSLPFPL
jgi:hypothetical protein